MNATNESRPKRKRTPAPYLTQHYRIPLPIKPQVMAMAREYREKAWAEYRQQQREANR